MQTEATDSIEEVPLTQVPEFYKPTTQDGFHSTGSGSLDGNSHHGTGNLSPDSAAAGSHSSTCATRVDALDTRTSRLSNQEERLSLPGERISAYENATTPALPQNMGFKVVKRSGPLMDGPSLTDCPNGM